MSGFSNQAYVRFNIFNGACILFRIINGGYMLLFMIWIILPFYMIHWFGQMKAYESPLLSKRDKSLVYISTILFLIATLFQPEEREHGSSYLIESIIGKQFPDPNPFYDLQYLLLFGWIFLADMIINIYFLIKLRRLKL